jgi:hypothetical protein
MINKILYEEKLINNYESILKYLSFQKININNELFKNIYFISKNNNIKNIDLSNIDVNLEQYNFIIRELKLFNKLQLDSETDYLYYILILESLPDFMIINLFRYFISNYIFLGNYDSENPDKLEKNKILKFITFKKLKYNFNDINKSNNPKKVLIETLEILCDNENNILFFIQCMNLFFT